VLSADWPPLNDLNDEQIRRRDQREGTRHGPRSRSAGGFCSTASPGCPIVEIRAGCATGWPPRSRSECARWPRQATTPLLRWRNGSAAAAPGAAAARLSLQPAHRPLPSPRQRHPARGLREGRPCRAHRGGLRAPGRTDPPRADPANPGRRARTRTAPCSPCRHCRPVTARPRVFGPASDATAPAPPERWCGASERPGRAGCPRARGNPPTPDRTTRTTGAATRHANAGNQRTQRRSGRAPSQDTLPLSVEERLADTNRDNPRRKVRLSFLGGGLTAWLESSYACPCRHRAPTPTMNE
jgi:hypothetical protein